MSKLKSFTYEKANGEISERTGIIVKEPHKNYLMMDLSDLAEDEQEEIIHLMDMLDANKEDLIDQYKDLIKWRTFKPEGITWK